MDRLWLSHHGRLLRSFALGSRYVEIGRGGHCDVVVHDEAVPERAYLIRTLRGAVIAYDLRQGGMIGSRIVLGLDATLDLGAGYSVRRSKDGKRSPLKGSTERLRAAEQAHQSLCIVIGRGRGARRVSLRHRPLGVGSASANCIVIHDRTVSRHHCRFEPFEGGVVVRDLGSSNGTWVGGHRVERIEIQAGAVLRVGRTDLSVVAVDSDRGEGSALVAESPGMLGVLAEADRYARLPWPVLVQGESGVGKERVAQALHSRGPRKAHPFVALNAGGLPAQLVESELFGHERGAFTGASAVHKGVFEQADGGTLFLDEIGELPLELQSRLLRVLETWQVRRVGGERDLAVDVRLVCATHRDLRARVAAGTFREDLFYRINRLLIEVPPLRKRVEDIRPLADHFLRSIEGEVGVRTLSEDAAARLLTHRWPGNARELRNVLCSAAASSAGHLLTAVDIDQAVGRLADARFLTMAPESFTDVVRQHKGNVSAAARTLGIPRSTLRDRLKTANGSGR